MWKLLGRKAAVEPPAPRQPSFVFIDDAGAETAWSLDAGRIHAVAQYLAAELPPGAPIGLLFRSGPDLVQNWFACVNAGLRPLIVQYPTRKQSRAYWFDSVTNTIQTAGLLAIISDDYCAGLELPQTMRIIRTADLPAGSLPDPGPVLPDQFAVLQLSSGTTGYRKAMEFGSEALMRHALDLNTVIQMRPDRDVVVSWLPLYHDMGYIACFVMPILLGIDVVMMDPVTWVQSPELLFDAIERHRGTICYMPNFAYEVMARSVPGRPLPSMRHWVSAGEQISAKTAAKFCAHIGADPASFSPLFGMAENLFGITLGSGYQTRVVNGAEIISCGPPIPGVELKTVDGEIHVRAETAIKAYLGGQQLLEPDGFYPSGDIGEIIDGELYVSGRKQDVLIQAGRKFMLADVDLKLNEAFPEVRGRAAALAIQNDQLGTETPLILIEAIDFFDRTDMAEIAQRMTDQTGMDQVEVAYVPPRFLTKTSSGKMNRRKSRADWLAVQQARHRRAGPRDAVQELRTAFGHVDWDRPMKAVLDSLSMAIVAITLETTAIAFDPGKSLNQVAQAWQANAAPVIPVTNDVQHSIRIVSLADRRVLTPLTEADLDAMAESLGCPVTLEHICLPPSPAVLSDLVFHDWFQPRLDQEPFSNVDQALDRLKDASLVLVDNFSEMFFLYESVYPVLSHSIERNPQADLLCFRWQNYTKHHDQLPLTFISGRDIPLDGINRSLEQLARYLATPIYRIASVPGFDKYTADWECHIPAAGAASNGASGGFVTDLTAWIAARPELRRTPLKPGGKLMMSDLAHFCGVMARKQSVDRAVEGFASFYVGAPSASLPYLRRRLDELGKPYVLTASFAPEIMASYGEKYECLVACGSWGMPPADMKMVAFQHIGYQGPRIRNVDQSQPGLRGMVPLNEAPPTPTDWYHNFELDRKNGNRDDWRNARQSFKGGWPALRAYVGQNQGTGAAADSVTADADEFAYE